jgi:hypothetical protein
MLIKQSSLLRDIWDFFNLGQFDPISQMIPLTVIPLIGNHCTVILLLLASEPDKTDTSTKSTEKTRSDIL